MFTGIVEEVGSIRELRIGSEGAEVTVACPRLAPAVRIGDSVAVNGVCLTATGVAADRFTCDISAETLRRTALGKARAGSRVNLERALEAGGRLGGHFVQGHVETSAASWPVPRPDRVRNLPSLPRRSARYWSTRDRSRRRDHPDQIPAAQGDFTVSVIPHNLMVTPQAASARGCVNSRSTS